MRKRLSRFKGAFAVLLLLPLCVMACGGSTEADTAAPKSPYELENMITENDADIASILADIGVIRAQIESIAVTNYSTAISEILARLATLEAHFVPTPTPTGAGGSPVPTTVPDASSGITASLVQTEIRAGGETYDFDVSVKAGASTLSKYIVLEIMPNTTDKPDITGTPTLSWSGSHTYTCTLSPSATNCELVRFVSDSKITVPSAATHSFSAGYYFDYASGATPVGWTYNWYLSD